MKRVTLAYFKFPFYRYRKINEYPNSVDISSSRVKVKKEMKEFGLKAVYPGTKTTQPNKEHEKHPYLLRGLYINRYSLINQVIMTFTQKSEEP